ncbi:MAG: T9SS type A sorting domain-containing protein [Candidatus Marinimicrobia bacterium]|nr:T9SS type A sorting domain-containing protein [Candidatus Neomarinimicrobiota bacterium]
MRKNLYYLVLILGLSWCSMIFANEADLLNRLSNLKEGSPEYNQIKTEYQLQLQTEMGLPNELILLLQGVESGSSEYDQIKNDYYNSMIEQQVQVKLDFYQQQAELQRQVMIDHAEGNSELIAKIDGSTFSFQLPADKDGDLRNPGCLNDNVPYGSSDLPQDCSITFTEYCNFGGEYHTAYVYEGNTYDFNTCAGSWDSQLTLYDDMGVELAFNDDGCGMQSDLTWTATYTGYVYLMIDQYNCVDNSSCIELNVSCTAAPAGCTENELTLTTGGGSFCSEVNWSIDGTEYSGTGCANWDLCLPDADYTINMGDTYGDTWNGNTLSVVDDGGVTIFNSSGPPDGCESDADPVCVATEVFTVGVGASVYGCTDPLAANYNPDATDDDGSCAFSGDTCEYPLVATIGENNGTGADQWFSFTPDTEGTVTISSCMEGQSGDTRFGVFAYCGDFSGYYSTGAIVYNDDAACSFNGLASTASFNATAGMTYYIFWDDGYGPGPFTWTITTAGGGADGTTCDTALPYLDVNDPEVYGSIESYGAEWWTFDVADGFTDVTISLCNSDYDTKLEIWDECGAANYFAANDDFCGMQSSITLSAPAAGTYYAKVFGWSSQFGNYALNITGSQAQDCTDNELTLYMYDSFGDGWNGNYFDVYDMGGALLESATLASGSSGEASLCLANDVYDIIVGGGSWQSEVSWELYNGELFLLSGGCPYDGQLQLVNIEDIGCMDPDAINYDPGALYDSGLCEYPAAPWGLTAVAGATGAQLDWNDPSDIPPIIQYHDDILQNAFYYYDTYDAGYAHGTRFDVAGVYDITAVSVKILSEGDQYWPWPNSTHGPVRVMVFDDNDGVPGNMIHDEYATATDGWATVYPGYTGMFGSFYVITSHLEDWSIAGDPEGYGIDGAVDFPDNMYTLDGGVWYTGDFNGYGGDYMLTAWVGGDYGLESISYHNNIPSALLGEDVETNTSAVHDGSVVNTDGTESFPSYLNTAERMLLGFDIYRDGVWVGYVDVATYSYLDEFAFDEFVDYCYTVRGIYDEGVSLESNQACVIFLGSAPDAPTNVTAEAWWDDVDVTSGITWAWDWSDGVPVIGDPCGDGMVYDCELFCVDEATAWSYVGDSFCDDGSWGYYLDCPEFENDGGDCGGGAMGVTINILTDNYGGETSWDIYDSAGNYVDGIDSYTLDNYTLYTWELVLDPGTYTFNVWDDWGDGIYCSDDGYYQLDVDGAWVAGGPGVGCDFAAGMSHSFTIGGLLLSSSEWILSAPINGEKGQSNYDMSGIELIQNITYQNEEKPYIQQTRAVFSLSDGTNQSMNVNRDTFFTLYFDYDGDSYAFTTSDSFIDIIGFDIGGGEEVCGVITATNDWNQESMPSDPPACAITGQHIICEYVTPENLMATDTGTSIYLEWTHPDYVDPSLVLGETMANPFIVDAVPYYDSGSTVGHMNDYDEVCPYTGSTSADVVYYWDAEPGDWTFDICESDYDTKIYVYDINGILVGCNDDACANSLGDNYRSQLGLTVLDYGPLYIIVDGYSGNSGNYNFEIYAGLPILSENDPQPVKDDDMTDLNVDRDCGLTHFNVYFETEEGGCAPGQFMDCEGFCVDDFYLSWIGDGFCDDGTYGVYLYCEEYNWDDGDCDGEPNQSYKAPADNVQPASRSWILIATTIYPNYEFFDFVPNVDACFMITADDMYLGYNESPPTEPECEHVSVVVPPIPVDVMAVGTWYEPENASAIEWSWNWYSGEPVIGDPCGEGLVYDCELFCVDEAIAWSYVGDTYCDDGSFGYYLDCPEFENDGGDCGGGAMGVTVTILTDSYGSETSWDIYDSAGNYVDGIESYTLDGYTLYTWELTLDPGTYTFNVWDDWGDGIYCSDDGYYQLDVDGVLIGGGPGIGCDFGAGMSHSFTIGGLLLSSSEWILSAPINGEKGQTDIDMSGIELIQNITYQNEVKPYVQRTRTVFDLANGTHQAINVNRDVFFTLYLTYDGVDYTFDTSDLSILITGFICEENICGVVTATNEFDMESDPSDTACAPSGCAPLCEYDPPENFTATADEMETYVHLEWTYPDYVEPACADFNIQSLPFSDVGSNVGMSDDWSVSGSNGADVAYQLTLAAGTTIWADLCSASTDYDTKLEIFTADAECVGTTTGWYDDDGPYGTCPDSPAPYTPSFIEGAYLDAGVYYIVVDGYSGAEGNYEINVWESAGLASLPPDPSEAMTYEAQKAGVDIADLNWNYPVENVSRTCEITMFNVYMEDANSDWMLLATTNMLSYDYMAGAEGCFHVTALDNYPDNWNESAPSNTDCANPCNGLLGDYNEDGYVNVQDIVLMVNYILNGTEITECQFFYADFNGDLAVNVQDIVLIVNCILNGCVARADEASSANFIKSNGLMTLQADGYVDGIQMTLSHGDDFSITLTSDAYIAEYVTSENITKLIIINPESNILFTTTGYYEVTEVLAATIEGMIETSLSTPSEFALSAAYPNPFNPKTTMLLELPKDGFISVKVYNVVGQVVDVLVDGNMTAGYHSVTWTATNVPSGMYFIRSTMGNEVQSQKVLLLK